MNTNEYYEDVSLEIAKDFGLEAGGYAPRPRVIPARIAQRIVAKYPPVESVGRWNQKPNPTAIKIAKRYLSLMMSA
jgi:hypothetical protein